MCQLLCSEGIPQVAHQHRPLLPALLRLRLRLVEPRWLLLLLLLLRDVAACLR